MALHLTPRLLELTYELLRATPPFNRWRMPHADEVEFRVQPLGCDREGSEILAMYTFREKLKDQRRNPLNRIKLCCKSNRWLIDIVPNMAHEMVHLHQHMNVDEERGRRSAPHGLVFKELARQVCRTHRFDFATF